MQRTLATDRSSPVRWVWSHIRPHWWIMVLMVAGAIGNAALAAVVPVLTGDAFNAMLKPVPDTSVLMPLAVTIAITQVIRGALQLARNFGAELLAQKLERSVRDELYLSLLGKSMTFHNLQPVGDTMARATNDVREVNYMFSPGVNLVVGSFIFLLMPLFVAPRYHPSLILVPAVYIILYFITLVRYLKTLEPVTDEVRATFGEMNTHLTESLDGVEVVKGASQENAEVDRFVMNASRVRDAFVRQGDLEGRYIAMALLGAAYAFGLFQALLLFRAGELNTGDVVAYFGLLLLLGFPTYVSTFAYSQISLGMSGARRILELIQRENNLDQNAEGYAGVMKGEVEFRNVSFSYLEEMEETGTPHENHPPRTSSDEVLENISFRVKAGQTVAIVGQTGAGKTSLVKLINRTYDAIQGQVLVDGRDVRVGQEGASQGNALALSAGKRDASLADDGLIALVKGLDEIVCLRKPGRGLHLFPGGLRLTKSNVVADRPREQENILLDHRDLRA